VEDPESIMSLVEGRAGDNVDRRTVVEILGRMDDVTQQIAVYYYLDDMSMEEVAETVGCSRKTVGKKLDHFKKRARLMLELAPGAR
jgi:RNA polymerase sigma-70 factor (ECF subfamily)